MTNLELVNEILAHYNTHMAAQIAAIDKFKEADDEIFKCFVRATFPPDIDFAEVMRQAKKRDNAREQMIEAFQLMYADFVRLAQAIGNWIE